MSSSRDRGSVVVADLVVGAMIVLSLAAAASAAGAVIDAGQSSREAARSGAVELARGNGPAPALRRAARLAPDDAEITYEVVDRVVVVRVHTRVDLPHPIAGRVPLPVTTEVAVPVAPYRSW